jgi:hypothetical protein
MSIGSKEAMAIIDKIEAHEREHNELWLELTKDLDAGETRDLEEVLRLRAARNECQNDAESIIKGFDLVEDENGEFVPKT